MKRSVSGCERPRAANTSSCSMVIFSRGKVGKLSSIFGFAKVYETTMRVALGLAKEILPSSMKMKLSGSPPKEMANGAVQAKQREILSLYKWDISQYDPKNKLYINDIFDILPSELDAKNKRFVLKTLNEHSRFSRYENGFIWLQNAGVALPTYNVEAPTPPLKLEEQRNLFKLFSNDVGLLAVQYAQDIALKILRGEVNLNYGAIYENFIAQELKAHGYSLYYFNSKKQGEVDFLLEDDAKITPVEVKSGKDYNRHRALNNIMDNELYNIAQAIILTCDNVKQEEKLSYLPIYMVMFIQKHQPSKDMIYKIEIPTISL